MVGRGRRAPHPLLPLAAALLAACGGPRAGDVAHDAASPKRPNVLLIVADDLGWTDLGHAGSGYYETPRLDALAAEGLRFTEAYANSANCAPTRAALMSGLHAARTGIYTVGSGARGSAERRGSVPPPNRTALDSDFVTLAERLQAQGYRTGFVGKWHLGSADAGLLPRDQGFDFAVGGDEQGHPPSYFYPYLRRGKGLPGLSPADGEASADPARAGEYLTDRVTEEALRFLDGNQGHPWFLMVSHYAVHTPIQAPEDETAHFRDKPAAGGHDDPTYAAMVARLDASVGALLDRLEEDGATRNTLVLFTSDNGGLGGYRAAGVPGSPEKTSNAPLRGGKGMFTEGGIRVPLLARWPGVTQPGTRCDTPVQLFDLYPTLVALAGGDPRAPLPLPGADPGNGIPPDGTDLAPLLRDPAAGLDREAIYFHMPGYLESGREHWRTTPVSVIRAGAWKLLEYYEDGHVELYDLDADLGEIRDLAAAQPERAAALRDLLHAWLRVTQAPMPQSPAASAARSR